MLSILAVAGTAAIMAAAPAASAFSLTASPPSVHLAAGQSTSIVVTNTGTKPLTVSARLASVGKVTGKCTAVAGHPSGITLSASSFSLDPGQSGVERVTVARSAPAQDDAMIFANQPPMTGTARVSGAVGSQVAIGSARVCGAHVAAPKTTSGGSGPLVPLVLSLAFLAAVGTLVITWVRRRRRPATEGA